MVSRPTFASGDTIPYAYGLRLGTHRGLRTVSRGGHDDAMRSEIIRFPDQRLTVVTLCNADHLEVRGERLVLRRQGQPDLTLLPIVRDQFVRGFGSWASSLPVLLQFERDSTRALASFTLSTAPGEDSVRGRRFVRVGR